MEVYKQIMVISHGKFEKKQIRKIYKFKKLKLIRNAALIKTRDGKFFCGGSLVSNNMVITGKWVFIN